MKAIDFKTPTKRRGEVRPAVTFKITPEFHQGLKEFANQQSETSGIKVSMGNVIETTLMQAYPTLRSRVTQLKKEKRDEKKYMDIKS